MPRRWSLRSWLILPAAAIATVLVLVGALLQTDTLVRAWLASARQLSELTARQTTEYVLLRLDDQDEVLQRGQSRREQWLSLIENDQKLATLLESTGARANSIVEVSVVDATGVVLASSNRSRPGRTAPSTAPLASITNLGMLQRIRDVWTPGREYELRVPVGLSGDTEPLFVVQVLVSNALLRETLAPGIRRIVASAGLAYVVALALVIAAAEITRRNLKRIGHLIDRIGGDEPISDSSSSSGASEFAAVESKLTLMQGRVRGALHEAQDYRQRVTALLKGLEEAIILIDGREVVLAAGPLDHLLGWSTENVAGRALAEVVPPGSALARLLEDSAESLQPVSNAEVVLPESGTARRLVVNIDHVGDFRLVRLRDAEGATHVESQLQISSRLEAINRLTGGVAHEIKNPLNSISVRLALLESIVEGDAEAEEEIRIVAGEIQRLDRVVRTFLDFTQPLELVREEINPDELARDVVELVRPDASSKGVEVQFRSSDEGLIIRGDPDLLKQALMNVVINAIEAMPDGGYVSIEVSRVDGQCRLRVRDTGPGIPEAIKNKMFQLYFTTKTTGSGIGLAVAYRCLQLHGGDIRVESEPGRGTTFDLTIPLIQREAAAGVP